MSHELPLFFTDLLPGSDTYLYQETLYRSESCKRRLYRSRMGTQIKGLIAEFEYTIPESRANTPCIPHDVRTVKRAYQKLCLLYNTGTYILQENRAIFNQYTVRDCCLSCDAGAEIHTHYIAGCSRLEHIRVNFKKQLNTI